MQANNPFYYILFSDGEKLFFNDSIAHNLKSCKEIFSKIDYKCSLVKVLMTYTATEQDYHFQINTTENIIESKSGKEKTESVYKYRIY